MSTLDDFILKIHTYKPATEYLKVYSNKVSLLSSKNSDSVSTGDRRFAVAGPRLLEEFTDFLASFWHWTGRMTRRHAVYWRHYETLRIVNRTRETVREHKLEYLYLPYVGMGSDYSWGHYGELWMRQANSGYYNLLMMLCGWDDNWRPYLRP